MSSHSRPTSSSSVDPSPFPEPPSSSSSSSTSSSNKILSVGSIQTIVPEMEEVTGDDVGNASDRSSSFERPSPHEGPDWENPKVFGIASVFHTDACVADFLNRVPVLTVVRSLLAGRPCIQGTVIYRIPFFFMYSCLFF